MRSAQEVQVAHDILVHVIREDQHYAGQQTIWITTLTDQLQVLCWLLYHEHNHLPSTAFCEELNTIIEEQQQKGYQLIDEQTTPVTAGDHLISTLLQDIVRPTPPPRMRKGNGKAT